MLKEAIEEAKAVAAAEKAAGDAGYLYRGVSANHPAIEAAKQGKAVPGNLEGTATPKAHNEGGVSANSPFTSWTDKAEIAKFHALKEGEGGVILRVPLGAPPPKATWSWEYSEDIFRESERLLRGVRDGAKVIKP
jgi:hypothetical protein